MDFKDFSGERKTNEVNKCANLLVNVQSATEVDSILEEQHPKVSRIALIKAVANTYTLHQEEAIDIDLSKVEDTLLPQVDFHTVIVRPFFNKIINDFLINHREKVKNGTALNKEAQKRILDFEKTVMDGGSSASIIVGALMNFINYEMDVRSKVGLVEILANSYYHVVPPFMKINISIFEPLQDSNGTLYIETDELSRCLNPEVFKQGANKVGKRIVQPDFEKIVELTVKRTIQVRGMDFSYETLVKNLTLSDPVTTGCAFDQFMNRIFPKFLQYIVELE